jgi:lipid-binding SYLF domain-containing protein
MPEAEVFGFSISLLIAQSRKEHASGLQDRGIPKDLLQDAECVAVVPSLKNVAFGFGGRYGRGAVSCRTNGGKGPWTG